MRPKTQPRRGHLGSSDLVRGRWWYTLRVAAVFWLIGVVTGPALGFALIFTDLSLILINVIGALVFASSSPTQQSAAPCSTSTCRRNRKERR